MLKFDNKVPPLTPSQVDTDMESLGWKKVTYYEMTLEPEEFKRRKIEEYTIRGLWEEQVPIKSDVNFTISKMVVETEHNS